MQRGDGRLDLVGTGRAHREGLVEQPGGLGDQLFVPMGPVLVGEPDQPPPAVEPGGGPGLVQQLQREQAEDLRLARHQPVQQPGQGHGLGGEVAPGGLAARAGQVALVEDQVDDGEHLGESFGQVVGIGHAHVGVHRPQDLAGPEQALGHGGFGDQEGGGDLGRGQAADGAQGQSDLRLAGQRRVAAGEDHAQQLVVFGVGAVPGVVLVVAASSASLSCPARARRSRSMALRRAVVASQPPQLAGTSPSRQCSMASMKASWTASSASPTSPSRAASAALIRVASSR